MALAKKKATTIALDPDDDRLLSRAMHDIARGAFTYAPPTVGQFSRAMEVDRRFADLGLGLVDGSVVALAESLGISRLATRDVCHFAAVRLRDGRSSSSFIRQIPTSPDIYLALARIGTWYTSPSRGSGGYKVQCRREVCSEHPTGQC